MYKRRLHGLTSRLCDVRRRGDSRGDRRRERKKSEEERERSRGRGERVREVKKKRGKGKKGGIPFPLSFFTFLTLSSLPPLSFLSLFFSLFPRSPLPLSSPLSRHRRLTSQSDVNPAAFLYTASSRQVLPDDGVDAENVFRLVLIQQLWLTILIF